MGARAKFPLVPTGTTSWQRSCCCVTLRRVQEGGAPVDCWEQGRETGSRAIPTKLLGLGGGVQVQGMSGANQQPKSYHPRQFVILSKWENRNPDMQKK
jgi:hypothetical protein